MAEIRVVRSGELPPGTVSGFCVSCTAEVVVDSDELTCPDCGQPVAPDSLPRQQRLKALGQAPPPARTAVEPSANAAVKTVTLRPTRTALRWDAATDDLLQDAEREEREAEAAYQQSRERYERAKREANYLRQLRHLIRVERTETALSAPKAEGKRWSRGYDACSNCETTAVPHNSQGRCRTCATYWQRTGQERPVKGPAS